MDLMVVRLLQGVTGMIRGILWIRKGWRLRFGGMILVDNFCAILQRFDADVIGWLVVFCIPSTFGLFIGWIILGPLIDSYFTVKFKMLDPILYHGAAVSTGIARRFAQPLGRFPEGCTWMIASTHDDVFLMYIIC